MGTNGVVDITILGAGPSGLAAAYYAGHRDASVRIVDSIEQLGGQVAAVYPVEFAYTFDIGPHEFVLNPWNNATTSDKNDFYCVTVQY